MFLRQYGNRYPRKYFEILELPLVLPVFKNWKQYNLINLRHNFMKEELNYCTDIVNNVYFQSDRFKLFDLLFQWLWH